MKQRNRIIVRTSIIGIIANVFLAAFKAFVGFLANSISVVLDAVNNLTSMQRKNSGYIRQRRNYPKNRRAQALVPRRAEPLRPHIKAWR